MLNKVILIGNLTRDVELRYTPSGTAIAKLGLATNRKWRDRNSGEDREETLFIDVSVFGRAAEIANQYLGKGRRVLVEGRLVLEQWVDQNGNNRSKHSIAADNVQFLDSKGSSEGQGSYAPQGNQGGYNQAPQQGYNNNPPASQPASRPAPDISIQDDEIPF